MLIMPWNFCNQANIVSKYTIKTFSPNILPNEIWISWSASQGPIYVWCGCLLNKWYYVLFKTKFKTFKILQNTLFELLQSVGRQRIFQNKMRSFWKRIYWLICAENSLISVCLGTEYMLIIPRNISRENKEVYLWANLSHTEIGSWAACT